MLCEGCGNKYAARIQIRYIEGQKVEMCDECGAAPINPCPDIYLEPGSGYRTNENICDSNGTPIPYSSKREKKMVMKMLGLRQADCAEKQHGGRLDSYTRKKYFT